jgi:hypothetical protein
MTASDKISTVMPINAIIKTRIFSNALFKNIP